MMRLQSHFGMFLHGVPLHFKRERYLAALMGLLFDRVRSPEAMLGWPLHVVDCMKPQRPKTHWLGVWPSRNATDHSEGPATGFPSPKPRSRGLFGEFGCSSSVDSTRLFSSTRVDWWAQWLVPAPGEEALGNDLEPRPGRSSTVPVSRPGPMGLRSLDRWP